MLHLKTLLSSAALLSALADASPAQRKVWPGWRGLKNLFIFGDSYTTTGFNYTLAQPNDANPLGNPPYPGWTAANGPNWVDFITTTYNQSKLYTVNLAYGGATVDSALVAPYLPTVLSLKNQVQDEYLPHYVGRSALVKWAPATTLFGIWIGINDVGNSYWLNNATLYDDILSTYRGLVEQLYGSGARNFLFLNVPPTDRSPLMTSQGDAAVASIHAALADFNGRVRNMTLAFNAKHPDAFTYYFDSNTVFNTILDKPTAYKQTSGLLNTTEYCVAYENGTPAMDTLDPTCYIPVNEYFWLNSLHPTYPVHNATADVLVKQLEHAR